MAAIHGLPAEEASLVKNMYLVHYGATLDHAKALELTADSIRTTVPLKLRSISSLRKEDLEFDASIKSIEATDDLVLLSKARRNLHTLLDHLDKDGMPSKAMMTATIWIDKSRGNYTERAKDAKKPQPNIHPSFTVIPSKAVSNDS